MITFNKIDKACSGKMGNKMFQYSFLRAKAKKLGVKYGCPKWIGDTIFDLSDTQRVDEVRPQAKQYNEPANYCGYTPATESITDGTEIFGFLQSPKYFNRDDVKRWFTMKPEFIDPVKTKYNLEDRTSIHIRLGDYTNLAHVYPPQSLKFYKKSLEVLGSNKVAIFSNDIELAKKKLKDLDADKIFITGNKDYQDMYLMTQCKNNIITNSTFSWWGSYLSNNNKTIVPMHWFHPNWNVKNDDLFKGLDNWQRVLIP